MVNFEITNAILYRGADKFLARPGKNKLMFLSEWRQFLSAPCLAGADKFLARPGRKQANVSVRMASISFGTLPCRKKKTDDSSRLDVVEIARVPGFLPRLFTSWSG